ncbi:MAG: PEP-CTERM sorting domain-containing protein [Candidatus Omnitrophica bacterium]|nr:PEP-CTERM sorting domain-containing protein [Candidatus Omnitrophota bacterium]MDD5737315.1 PEP-CTERM sorting domain-containing protein [Candidatus Omnitrophota bacterium]
MGKLVALVSLVVLLVPGVASANLLSNGSFENDGVNGHVTGWGTNYPANNIYGVASYGGVDGSYSAVCFWDGDLYQDVEITGGQSYSFSGNSYIPTESETVGTQWNSFVKVNFLNSSNIAIGATYGNTNLSSLTRDQWNQVVATGITAPANAVKARVSFGTWQNSTSSAYIPNPTMFDDFNFDVAAVPEPASLLLLGSGLIGLVGFSRKK